MERKDLDLLAATGQAVPVLLTKADRVRYLAMLLTKSSPDMLFEPLRQVEYKPYDQLEDIKVSKSPLRLIFGDAAFGVVGQRQTFGNAVRALGYKDPQEALGPMHQALCDCHHSQTMDGKTASGRLLVAHGLA